MFSGFDHLAEGFKRFSLDALQQEDDQDQKQNLPHPQEPPQHDSFHHIQLQATAPVSSKTVPGATLPAHADDAEGGEWDWNPGESEKPRKSKAHARTHSSGQGQDVPPSGVSSPPALYSERDKRDAEPSPRLQAQTAEEQQQCAGEGRTPIPLPTNRGEVATQNGSTGSNTTRRGTVCDLTIGDERTNSLAHSGAAELEEASQMCAGRRHVAHQNGSESSRCIRDVVNGASDDSDEAGNTKYGGVSEHIGEPGEQRNVDETTVDDGGNGAPSPAVHGNASSPSNVPEAAMTPEQAKEAAADVQALATARHELAEARGTIAALQGAVRTSQSHVQGLRETLTTQNDTVRRQAEKLASLSDEVHASRTGFRESNEAHQRTAERCQAFERELDATRRTADSLRAEASSLKAQVNVAAEDRHALEAQLRQLEAGLTEGQEAARQEGRREVERLEARVKDLLKERERKSAELELQNARRKETREMARDLESQLAAVDRISQVQHEEREVELTKLREEMAGLRANTSAAAEGTKTWTAKYEALERNFKQVRAQGKRAEAEAEELREKVAKLEAEKTALAGRVEDEGAERVTVVASITHERDFLMRQARQKLRVCSVDRLEKDVFELQSSRQEQADAAAARAQATGILEDYKTRAQQALKRANEIRSQTAAANLRLQADMERMSDEVAEQRPLWEKAKQDQDVQRAEIAKLREQLSQALRARSDAASAVASMEEKLLVEEEQRSNTHASVVRLEAQGKSLRQELQRHQKALAASQEREAALDRRLTENASSLKSFQDTQGQYPQARDEKDAHVTAKYPASPVRQGSAPGLRWDEDKQYAPPNGVRNDAAGTPRMNRRGSRGGSFGSLPSDGDSADAQAGSVAEQLVYVHQLRERMNKEQVEMRSLISELEASRAAAHAQAAKQVKLERQLETALLDKKRLQELDQGRNAAINLEYLKNCVVGCLRTSEPSEHARLLPVITTILKLSSEEADIIARNITDPSTPGKRSEVVSEYMLENAKFQYLEARIGTTLPVA